VCFRGLVTVLNKKYFPTEGGAVKTSPGEHTVHFDEMLGDGGYENTIILITILIIYRLKYHTAVLVYKALNNQAPKYISHLFVNVSSHTYILRASTRGDIIPKSKIANTKNLLNTFSNKGKNISNMIPVNIRNTSSIKNF